MDQKTPNTDTFHVVQATVFVAEIKMNEGQICCKKLKMIVTSKGLKFLGLMNSE